MSGLDYGFFNFKSLKATYVFKFLSVLVCATWSGISVKYVYFDDNDGIIIWFYEFLAKYVTTVLYLVSIKPYTSFHSYFYKLYSIDTTYGVDATSFNIELKILCMSFSFVALRLTVNTLYFLIDPDFFFKPLLVSVIYLAIFICSDILLILYTFIFYATNCRLKNLSSILMQPNTDYSSIQMIYKLYIDNIEISKKYFDALFIIFLIFNVPEIMATIYISVSKMREQNISVYGFWWSLDKLLVMEALLLTFAPAICAGMLTTEANQIQIILHDKLLQEREPIKVREIERFIRYVEARPCRFRVWKVIPLDADLLGMVLSFCVTYLIVIIQFTHVY
ncbi:Gustatory receptor 14 [Operophtera brumata]|uniref:Gustatory receptor n=1 Tax=Operophtera brumata TaxID=104452 RepID=A0A0L7LBC9_OPEBR|nr:Gustatory receptor 14 [Operophtera brumata]